MSNKSYIKDENGKTTAIRYTSGNGRKSWDYEYDSSKFFSNKGSCISVNHHNTDGTTTSYEHDGSLLNSILHFDERGKRKSN